MRILALLTIAVMLSMPQLLSATMLATGTVNGVLVDSTGKAAPNQKVRIKKVLNRGPVGSTAMAMAPADNLTVATATTDKDGKFSQSLEPGEYWAEAGSKNLGYAKERFEIKAGEATDVKLSLTKDDVKGN